MQQNTYPELAEKALNPCQYPTEFDEYGQPVGRCGKPAVEHRPDRLIFKYACEGHTDLARAVVNAGGATVTRTTELVTLTMTPEFAAGFANDLLNSTHDDDHYARRVESMLFGSGICKNCHQPIVDVSGEGDTEREWEHTGASYYCHGSSGTHAEPASDNADG